MSISTGSDTLPRETYRNLIRVHERLTGQFAQLFRSQGVSPAQYNVMRILREAPPEGAPCQYIGARLLTKVPDVTRLIDRMVASDLVRRERSSKDRRIVLVHLTGKGRDIHQRLDGPVEELHTAQLGHLSEQQVQGLNCSLLAVLSQMLDENSAGQSPEGPKE
ncbi:MAG: MarR family transcriptional regulator [Planctomycetes bacterium]|nr:MarR family transcriptional regulator [Planctomycetota bacterium]